MYMDVYTSFFKITTTQQHQSNHYHLAGQKCQQTKRIVCLYTSYVHTLGNGRKDWWLMCNETSRSCDFNVSRTSTFKSWSHVAYVQ